jgi:hypothetical protein
MGAHMRLLVAIAAALLTVAACDSPATPANGGNSAPAANSAPKIETPEQVRDDFLAALAAGNAEAMLKLMSAAERKRVGDSFKAEIERNRERGETYATSVGEWKEEGAYWVCAYELTIAKADGNVKSGIETMYLVKDGGKWRVQNTKPD